MSASLTLSPFLISQPEDTSGLRDASTALISQTVNFPQLQPGQFAVGISEVSKTPGNFQNILEAANDNTPIRIFNSFDEARAYAIETIVARPFHQCLIFDANRQHVHTIQNGQPIPLEELLARQPKPPKAWWQIWK